MNTRTLLVMFLLVAAAAAWLLLDKKEGKATSSRGNPLRSIDFSGIQSVGCRVIGNSNWEARRDDKSWRLTSPGVAGGKEVVADADLIKRIFGFLQDVRPLMTLPAKDLDLNQWGLAPPAIVLEVVDGGGRHELHFGKADLQQELWFRAADGDEVFKAPATTAVDLLLEPNRLRQPRMTDWALHEIAHVEVKRPDGRGFVLDRSVAHWTVAIDGGRPGRADGTRAEQIANGLSGMVGEPGSQVESHLEAGSEPAYRVTIRHEDGRLQSYSILEVNDEKQYAVARRDDEPDLRRITGEYRRFFDLDAKQILDSRLLDIDPADLGKLKVSGSGRPDTLEAREVGGHWFLHLGPDFDWRADPDDFRGFRDAVLGLRIDRRLDQAPAFETAFELTLERKRSVAAPPVVVRIGPADAAGRRPATRSDEEGGVELAAGSEAVLGRPAWKLLGRFLANCNEDAIDRIAITDPEGIERCIERREDRTFILVSVKRGDEVVQDPKSREVPKEFLQGLMVKLTFFAVESCLGPMTPALAEHFVEPRYRLAWRHPERPRPAVVVGPWIEETKVVEIGTRIDDSTFPCRINTFPDLVFSIKSDDLTRLEDALRGMR